MLNLVDASGVYFFCNNFMPFEASNNLKEHIFLCISQDFLKTFLELNYRS